MLARIWFLFLMPPDKVKINPTWNRIYVEHSLWWLVWFVSISGKQLQCRSNKWRKFRRRNGHNGAKIVITAKTFWRVRRIQSSFNTNVIYKVYVLLAVISNDPDHLTIYDKAFLMLFSKKSVLIPVVGRHLTVFEPDIVWENWKRPLIFKPYLTHWSAWCSYPYSDCT